MGGDLAFPRSPRDIPHEQPMDVLAAEHTRHALRLIDHRHGLCDPLPDGQVAAHLLAVLAYRAAIAERAVGGRWVYAAEALVHAPADRIAEAMGLSVDELAAQVRQLVAASDGRPVGRRTVARHLGVSEHRARALLEHVGLNGGLR